MAVESCVGLERTFPRKRSGRHIEAHPQDFGNAFLCCCWGRRFLRIRGLV